MKGIGILSSLSIAVLLMSGCSDKTNYTATETGYFIDSPVSNIEYRTQSGYSGITDESGTFHFNKDENVTFRIGKLILGEGVPTSALMTPQDIAPDSDSLNLTLQLLQSLDEDKNVSNGIKIPDEVLNSLRNKAREINIKDLTYEDLLKLDISLKEHIDSDGDGKLDVDSETAVKHFEESVVEWKEKLGIEDVVAEKPEVETEVPEVTDTTDTPELPEEPDVTDVTDVETPVDENVTDDIDENITEEVTVDDNLTEEIDENVTDEVDENITETTDILTAQFLDSFVSNLEYDNETSTDLTGRTDENGTFTYHLNDKVKFHIGKLNLGEVVVTESIITPAHLSEDNDTVLTTILQLLQSVDEDSNLTNGIQIPDSVVDALSSLTEEVNVSELTVDELLALNDTLKAQIDKDGDGKLDVDEVKARNHFKASLDSLKDLGYDVVDGSETPEINIDPSKYSLYELSDELKEAITRITDEEKLSFDLYSDLYNKFVDENITIEALNDISQSEADHLNVMTAISAKYELNITESNESGEYSVDEFKELYSNYIDGSSTQEEALKVGCRLEVKDIDDLDQYIGMAEEIEAKDVVDILTTIREKAFDHYATFDKALKDVGVDDGCCSIGEEDGVDYCRPDYLEEDVDDEDTDDDATTEEESEDEESTADTSESDDDTATEENTEEENTTEDTTQS